MATGPPSARASFNRRFWYADGGYLYDVVDGEDGDDAGVPAEPALRHLARAPGARPRRGGARCWTVVRSGCSRRSGCARWRRAIPTTRRRYDGDLRARDAAYHQGTVWAWLIGPFVDAWLRVHPEDRARGAPSPGRLLDAPRRGVRRHHQRDLRRRAAVHAARLRRPGLERGRGAARARPDGGTRAGGARPSNARRTAMTDVTARAAARPAGPHVMTRRAGPAAGADALASRQPDVLVSRLGMPGKDGDAFIRRVRARPGDRGGRGPR